MKGAVHLRKGGLPRVGDLDLHHARVLRSLQTQGSTFEVEERTGLPSSTVYSRVVDLFESGRLEVVGGRPSPSNGKTVKVYALTEDGRKDLSRVASILD